MGAHATRSASGNKRWMNCPGSIRLSEGRPNESSAAARLGTAAHGLGEYCLLRPDLWPADMVGGEIYLDEHEDAHVFGPDIIAQLNSDQTIAVPAKIIQLVAAGHEAFPIDTDMADAVQVYVSAVREELENRPGAELMVEHRSSLNELIGYDWPENDSNLPLEYVTPMGMFRDGLGPVCNADGTPSAGPMFGTNDAAVLQLFEHLTIFDYKHGQGVVVEVAEMADLAGMPGCQGMRGNTQLMQYALGTARSVDWAFDTLDLVIVQPRARHADGSVRRYSTTKDELKTFEEELRLAAHAVERLDAPLAAGSWCQFCPAAGIPCPELHESVIRIARVDFSDGEPQIETIDEGSPDDKLEQALAVVPLLDTYIKAIRGEALRRLTTSADGTGFGYKLVRGKSNRAWQDKDTVVEQLVAKGFTREELYEEPKLKSPSKVETLRPKKLLDELKASGIKAPVGALKAIVADFSHKPEGKVVVAPMSDPRDPVSPTTVAASDFDAVEEE